MTLDFSLSLILAPRQAYEKQKGELKRMELEKQDQQVQESAQEAFTKHGYRLLKFSETLINLVTFVS